MCLPAWLKHTLIALIWLIIWEVVSLIVANPLLICGPLEALEVLIQEVSTSAFWFTVGTTLGRIAVGFIVACALGVILGCTAGHLSLFESCIAPLMHVIKSTPVVCIIALLLIWYGAALTTSIIVGLVVIPPFYFAMVEAMHLRDESLDRMLDVFPIPFMRRVLLVRFPRIIPFFRSALKSSVGMAWKAGIAAELIGLPALAIGEQIYLAKLSLDTASIISWTFVVIVLGWASEKLLVVCIDGISALPAKVLDRECIRAKSEPCLSQMPAPAAILFEGVNLSFGANHVLVDMDLSVAAGERLCLIAPSGSGKTSLLALIAGTLKQNGGSPLFPGGAPVVSMTFQEPLFDERSSAPENLALTARTPHELALALDLLNRLIPDRKSYEGVPIRHLSGGMRKRVQIARALAHPSSVLLLDEPFAGLDATARKEAAKIILDTLYGRTLLLATHEHSDAELLGIQRICDQLA